jgi:2-aminobenzoate-CoA ligase
MTMQVSGADDAAFVRQHLPSKNLWPERPFSLPELQYPDRLNCAEVLLEKALDPHFASRRALAGSGICWTYAELYTVSSQIALTLQSDYGLKSGQRVLISGTNHPWLAACLLAVIRAGAIAVPAMPMLRAKELSAMTEQACISHVLCDEQVFPQIAQVQISLSQTLQVIRFREEGAEFQQKVHQANAAQFHAADTARDDPCLIAFTSGTTGKPKATVHFHEDMLAICDLFPRSVLRVTEHDVFTGTPPLAFTFGLGGLLLFPLRYGASSVLLEHYTPQTLLTTIAEHHATVCYTAPTCYRQMIPLLPQADLRSLRTVVSAGEVLPVATRTAFESATGLTMIDGIGSTEMLHIFIAAAGDEVRPGATGKAIPGYQACVLDQNGQRCPPGVVGRLAVKGPTGCRYLNDTRQQTYVQNGWNLTGDAYATDQDGYFYYHGRIDDMIVSAGYNIAASEVEDALLAHEQVAECAVIGVPDPMRGQLVKAFVVLRETQCAAPEMVTLLQQWVKQRIAPYKYPRLIEFVSVLPRTDSGKLQRYALRQAELQKSTEETV